MLGALLGFLVFNAYPAKVFMGDTGSLALGAVMGTIAIITHREITLLIVALVFVIETLSVIIQVTSFKLTGKRVFKMSPIHHHFELCGWSEKKIVLVFGLVSALMSTLAVLIFMWSNYGLNK